MSASVAPDAVAFFSARDRWRADEIAVWLCAAASYFLFPGSLLLGSQVLIAGLFALSLDLLVGYTGIASLGHAAFFGLGAYTAGLLAVAGWTEPVSSLLAAAVVAGAFGLLCSTIVSRVRGIALLTVTLGIGLLLFEVANRWRDLTGGDDGLQGVTFAPVFGVLEFDLSGRGAFIYAFAVTLVCYVFARRLVGSPFGLQLHGIRGNLRRIPALGISAGNRLRTIFAISAALAGIAGAVLAETTQFVALEVLSFDRSLSALIMVVLGGIGTLSGGIIGAALYLVARDWLSELSPVYWNFWLGLILFLVVISGSGGVLGVLGKLRLGVGRR
ncbi:MAG: branched-chain amino acid ABC transporter permease [Acidisphaera sp.]|nr:branched-chain amino acid ABC transporter permease [Acidisphaera sp.]